MINEKNTTILNLLDILKKKLTKEKKITLWKFGQTNASLVVQRGGLENNIFSLLTSCIFIGELCLFKTIDDIEDYDFNVCDLRKTDLEKYPFFHLSLTANQYYLQYLSYFSNYSVFMRSAWLYLVKSKVKTNFITALMCLFYTIKTQHHDYKYVFQKDISFLQIVSIYPKQSLQAFFRCFSLTFSLKYVYGTLTIQFKQAEKHYGLFLCMKDFKVFSKKFQVMCYKQCFAMNSHIPVLLALKIYQKFLLNPSISYKELKLQLASKISCCVDSFVVRQHGNQKKIEKN